MIPPSSAYKIQRFFGQLCLTVFESTKQVLQNVKNNKMSKIYYFLEKTLRNNRNNYFLKQFECLPKSFSTEKKLFLVSSFLDGYEVSELLLNCLGHDTPRFRRALSLLSIATSSRSCSSFLLAYFLLNFYRQILERV